MPTQFNKPGDSLPFYAWLVIVLLATLPVAAYIVFVVYLHRDLPIFDDYILQLELVQLKDASTAKEKLQVLFSQLNEHRLVYTRCWFWLIHTLNGTLSYSALIAIGNLPLLGVWGLFGWLLHRLRVPWIAGVPLSWILFQFQYHDNSLWAMASLQNLTIHLLYPLLFVLVCCHQRTAWYASWGVALLLCFTSGNGFIALPLAGAALVYQRRWHDLGWWTALTSILVILYFWTYQRPANFPTANHIDLLNWGKAVLVFLGLHADCYLQSNSVSYFVANGLAIVVPVVLLTGWSCWQLGKHWITRRSLGRWQFILLVCLLMTGFVVISAGAAVQNRFAFTGWRGLIESRYRLYSTMLVLIGYVQFMALATHRRWPVHQLSQIAICIVVLMWLGIYRNHLSRAYLFRSRALAMYFNWTQTQTPLTQQKIVTVFKPSDREATVLNWLNKSLSTPSNQHLVNDGLIASVLNEPNSFVIGNAELTHSSSPKDWTMLVFWATDHVLLFPVYRPLNGNWRSFWLGQSWFGSGFRSETVKGFMQPMPYRLGVLIQQNDSIQVYQTRHIVRP